MPWDRETVIESVRRTGHLVIVEENQRTGGWGTEIASVVGSAAFSDLRAPILRITAPDVPVPYGAELEKRFLPSGPYVLEQVSSLLSTKTTPSPWWEEFV
jgi:pyruvate dehydrogenase E1 component beta subunit